MPKYCLYGWPQILGLCVLLASPLMSAQPIQKWQDSQGQWHFGDASAAGHRKTQAVYIRQPLSIVHQDHALPSSASSTPKSKQSARRPHSRQTSPRSTPDQCNQWRDQLRLLTPQQHREQQDFYEKNCIAGHYYGQSNR